MQTISKRKCFANDYDIQTIMIFKRKQFPNDNYSQMQMIMIFK